MPGTIHELFDSRGSTEGQDNPSVTLRYIARGADDDIDVDVLAAGVIPALYNGKFFQSYKKDPLGGGVWEIEARYGKREPKGPGDWDFQFDTSGGTSKVTQGLAAPTVYTLPSTPNLPIDHHTNINEVDENGETRVEGVEINIGAFSFTATRTLADPISPAYLNLLIDATEHVNDDTVVINLDGVTYTFQPGELKFDHATGGKSGGEEWKISIKCSVNRNKTGLAFGGITGVSKKGWEYLWVDYGNSVDPTSNRLVKVPVQVNVEQVIPTTSLAGLFA